VGYAVNALTSQTRREALERGDKDRDLALVYGVFCEATGPLGAVQVAEILHREVTSIRPRVSNLFKKLGQIQSVGKRKLPNGGKETVYIVKRFDADGQGIIPGLML
jgi:hypothetical protein